MSKTNRPSKLSPLDVTRYLTDDAAITEYIAAILETGSPDLLPLAFDDVARACGMARNSEPEELEKWRGEILREIQAARRELAAGRCLPMTPAEILRRILSRA